MALSFGLWLRKTSYLKVSGLKVSGTVYPFTSIILQSGNSIISRKVLCGICTGSEPAFGLFNLCLCATQTASQVLLFFTKLVKNRSKCDCEG